MSTILHLLLGNLHGRCIVPSHHELLELNGSCNVAPLTNIQEWEAKVVVNIINNKVLQPRQPHLGPSNRREGTGRVLGSHILDGLNVGRGGATAATHKIDPTILEEDLIGLCHVLGGVIIASHGIGKTSIGVDKSEAFCYLGDPLKEGDHVVSSKGTVDTNTHGLGVTDGGIEGLTCLA